MKRLLVLALVGGIALTVWGLCSRNATPPVRTSPLVTRAPYDPTVIHRTVAFYEGRTRRDPQGAIEWEQLAGWYLQRCRETGDIDDALRAERAARRSLQIRTRRNAAAYLQLALSLNTQHRFAEGLRAAEQAAQLEPDNRQAEALRAEICIELGDYEAAKRLLQTPSNEGEDTSRKALRARMLEIEGQPELALNLLRAAQFAADANLDMARENVAWYHLHVGTLLANMGRARDAERAYREAIDLFPRDYKAMAGLARLNAGLGHWQETLSWGQKASAIVPTPDVAALMSDAYTALGNRKAAQQQVAIIEAIGTLMKVQGTQYDRQRALFCADHGVHLDEAFQLARRELKARHDIYAYDTLAWASFKKGLLPEAWDAMQKAMARGTQDAMLFYHAGQIAYARGERATAKTYLTRALAINPYFQPFAPEEARALLAKIP